MPVELRIGTGLDASALADFRLRLLAEMGLLSENPEDPERRQREQELSAYFAQVSTEDCLSWIAEADGQVVGAGSVNFFRRIPYPRNPSGKEMYLLNMYTLPAWRGRGIARAILDAVIAYGKAHGYGRIWLHASAAGEPLYRQQGFKPRPAEMELFLT